MKIAYASKFEKIIVRLKKEDRKIFGQVCSEIDKIIRVPETGKPLRYSLKNRRRVHLGSFVLVYEFHNDVLRFLDFDHHDNIYKRK